MAPSSPTAGSLSRRVCSGAASTVGRRRVLGRRGVQSGIKLSATRELLEAGGFLVREAVGVDAVDDDEIQAALSVGGQRVRVLAVADHPASYAAGRDRPGIAFADLATSGPPD